MDHPAVAADPNIVHLVAATGEISNWIGFKKKKKKKRKNLKYTYAYKTSINRVVGQYLVSRRPIKNRPTGR
jgi:hypothetical protein